MKEQTHRTQPRTQLDAAALVAVLAVSGILFTMGTTTLFAVRCAHWTLFPSVDSDWVTLVAFGCFLAEIYALDKRVINR